MVITSIVTAAVFAKLTSAGIIKEPKFLKNIRNARAAKNSGVAK